LSFCFATALSHDTGITLLVVDNDYYKICNINYRGGLRYPHLVRDEFKPDYLADLIKPRAMN
jgi:hypothetical protein